MTENNIHFHKYCSSLLYPPSTQNWSTRWRTALYKLSLALILWVCLRRYLVGLNPLVYQILEQCRHVQINNTIS